MIVKILNAYMSTVMGENIMPIVDVNQYDHNGKQIQILVRDMDISGMYAVVDGKKPDDTYVYNKTTMSDSSVFIDITLQMTAVSGSYDMQVTLFDESDDSRAGIYKYTLRIAAATVPDPTVVSTDEYTALVTNAKEYDDAAAASAAAASASAASAAESERLSGISATDAAASNQNAATHEQDAKGYADNAAQSNAAGEQSATNANTAKTDAQAARDATITARTGAETARDAAVTAKTAAEAARERGESGGGSSPGGADHVHSTRSDRKPVFR